MNKLQFCQAVWHSADVGMCVTDLEGTYLEVNDAYCRIYGYERAELIGANFLMMLPASEQQRILRLHKAFLLGHDDLDKNDVGKGEYQVRRKDGTLIDVWVTAARVIDEAGNVFEVTTVTDMSERNALLHAERYQRQLSDAQTAVLAQVVSQTDVHTVLNTILEHVNALVPCDASCIALLEQAETGFDTSLDTSHDINHATNHGTNHAMVRVTAWRNNNRISLEPAYQTFAAPLSALKLEQATLQQGSIIVTDAQADSRLSYDGDRGGWIHSFATIPLRVQDTVLGWLWLDAEARGAFDQATINALQPLADAAAIALRNTQLYAQSRHELAEKERVQGELTRSEAHMRKLLQALPDGFVRHDRAGRYLEVHVPEGFQPVRPAAEIVGNTIDDVLPAAVAAQIHRHLEQLFATGEMQKQDYNLTLAGEPHYREVRWVRLSDQEAFGLVRDTTEQKRVEEALKQSEALFRNLFEHSSLGIALVDGQGRFFDVNAAFCALTGYDRQALIGTDPKTITHPDDVSLTLMFAKCDKYQIEKRYLNPQGEVIWVLVSATRLQTSAKQPVTIIKHVQDISAQKQLERDLQTSQQRLESIVTTLPDVVLTLAADNTVSFSNAPPSDEVFSEGVVSNGGTAVDAHHQEARAPDASSPANNAIVPLLEVEVGQNFKDIVPKQQRASLLDAFERVRSRGGMAQLEVCLPALAYRTSTRHTDVRDVNASHARSTDMSDSYIDKMTTTKTFTNKLDVDFVNDFFNDGTVNNVLTREHNVPREAERWFLLRVRPGEAGSHELVVVMTDISDIKRSTMRLERALTERTTLLKEIHHRVKNNMQVISSLLHLRAQTLASDEQGQVARASLRDSRERIRAMALVHEVMYETQHFDAIDFHVYLDKLLYMVMQANRIDDVHLVLALEPVTLHIDQAIPCGLIANELLSNALEHAFGDQSQAAREIRVGVSQQGREVSFEVRDNGIGLPSKLPNTHLGMTIIESLVLQLEGTLTLTNREPPAHGLIANVRFPNALPVSSLDDG